MTEQIHEIITEHNPRTRRESRNHLYDGRMFLDVYNHNTRNADCDKQEIQANRPTFYGGSYAANIAGALYGLEVTYQDNQYKLLDRDDVPDDVKSFIREIFQKPVLYRAVRKHLPVMEYTGKVRPVKYILEAEPQEEKEEVPLEQRLAA